MSELGNRSMSLSKWMVMMLMIIAIPAANAFDLDITNDPNKDFFIGYGKHYNEDS